MIDSEKFLSELLEASEDKEWSDFVLSNPVTISETSEDEHLRGKIGRITDVVIPNSDACVFSFVPDDGSAYEWVCFEDIVIKNGKK